MKNHRILITLLMLPMLVLFMAFPVFAESVDWSGYTYDELIALRRELDDYIKEMEKQYAIEHGNRVISLNETEIELYRTKTFALSADVKRVVDDAPEETDFVWSSSDESVAKVSERGVVTGIDYGDAVITCMAADDENVFAEAMVHVVLPVTGVMLDQNEAVLMISDREPSKAETVLHSNIVPENALVKSVVWSSSNEAVATVDSTGRVCAVAPGTATVTATSEDTFAAPKSAVCRIIVQRSVESIELDAAEITLNVGARQNLLAAVLPDTASQRKLTWESSNPSVAAVSNGKITAVSPGSATITCTAMDGSNVSASCQATVIQMINNLQIDPAGVITINKNESALLKTVISPDDATNRKLEWSSSDKSIVVVDKMGKVTAVGGGAATVTCTATDGSQKAASVDVYVPSIAVDAQTYTVASMEGLDIPFRYYGKLEDFQFSPEECAYFSAEVHRVTGENLLLHISPDKAGTASIKLMDQADKRSQVEIKVEIAHSACYDSTSYPTGDYASVMRAPSSYKGRNMSVYGRILQLQKGWFGSVTMRVATLGRWDNIFYITCSEEDVEGIIEDDYITVYGECDGTETYRTIMGGSVTIPAIKAEKVFLGKH